MKLQQNITTENNWFALRTAADFPSAGGSGVMFQNGFLQLLTGRKEGEFRSGWIETSPFSNLVCWWNAWTPALTFVEVSARVRVDGEVTPFLSWGRWSTGVGRASADTTSELADVDTDVLTIRDGKRAEAVQVKIRLFSDGAATPLVFGLGATWRDGTLPPSNGETDLPKEAHLVSPVYSQMIREPDMAHVMCSAVTATTLLNDRGLDLLPEQLALVNYDERYQGYGNWAFTMAAAASFGFCTQLRYGNLDLLRRELAAGRSVGINVTYSDSPEGKYPYIAHAATANTGGHLLTVTGYGTEEGIPYFDVHDSAAVGDENCVLRYRADQLERAWTKGIAYLAEGRAPTGAAYLPRTLDAALTRAETKNAYNLMVDGVLRPLPQDFYEFRLHRPGCGIIACCVLEEESPLPTGVKRTVANHEFFYDTTVMPDGALCVNAALLNRSVGKTLLFFIMENTGVMIRAALKL